MRRYRRITHSQNGEKGERKMEKIQLAGINVRKRLLRRTILGIILVFFMVVPTLSSLVTFAQTSGIEVPRSPYYPQSNEDWWLYQFEGVGYQSSLEGHSAFSNTNCGPACTAMVVNYLKGKGLTTRCEGHRISPDYPVYCYARWLYCQANGHPSGFASSDWSIPGATTQQIQYALSVEGIQSHIITGNECKNDGTGINNIQSAIDQGKLLICLVAPMYYRENVNTYFSHWTIAYGYDADYIFLNDPGYQGPPSGRGYRASKADFADAIWLVQELSTVIIIDTTMRGRSGGPDSFGYTYLDSNTPRGPTYDWIEISGTGTEILPDSDDQWVGNINLGFFFNYYGTDYTQLAIGNNGLLFSGVGTSQYVNQPITQTPSIHGFIAPFWDDIVTWGSAGAIYYQTIGTAPNRKFVVEWYDNQHYSSSTSGITFEAILYEGTNNILFQYQDVSFGIVSGAVGGDNPPYDNGGSATVGIEDPTGSIGLQYSFNEQVITSGLAILFKFPAFAGTNMYLSMNAPASMDHGNTMTYTLYYNDFGDVAASNVVLQATLSPNVAFVSASDGGSYDLATKTVTWNIGTVPAFPSGRGSRTVTVTIPASVPVGTVIHTTASISTSTLGDKIRRQHRLRTNNSYRIKPST
jgi:uncharacterized repeat protein (TIGR01451 family)